MMHPNATSRAGRQRAGAVLAMLAACLSVTVSAQTRSVQQDAHDGGIWKSATPRQAMKGEFNSMDPLGVAAGAEIKADCSLNWVDPDNGALYCFSSGTSLEYFLDHPKTSILQARQGWHELHRDAASGTE